MLTLAVDNPAWLRVDATLRDVAATFLPKVGARALNRAAGAARTLIVRAVAADLGVKQAALKPFIGLKPATAGHLEARVFAKGKRGIPLIELNASGPEPSLGKGGGVSVRANPSRYAHAFIATTRSGHRAVFARVPGANRRGPAPNRSQLPIQELFTRPIRPIFAAHRGEALARISDALRTNLISELRYALRGRAA